MIAPVRNKAAARMLGLKSDRQRISVADGFATSQAAYRMANRQSRFGSDRTGDIPSLGADANWHYRSDLDYIWMGETAREMDRNDPVLGQIVDRVIDNEIQEGFKPQADCGDPKVDEYLEARHAEESQDPEICDITADRTFHDQECLVARESKVVGDTFVLPVNRDGRESLSLVENYRCRGRYLGSARKSNEAPRNVSGVVLDADRQPLQYTFTKDNVNPFSQSLGTNDLETVEAWEFDPVAERRFKKVWHIADRKRPSQTRGVTALAPIFEIVGMHDDIQYSKLVQQQIHSFFCFIHQRELGWEPPIDEERRGVTPRRHRSDYDNETEEYVPGMRIEGDKGETVNAWSAAVPNPEFFEHAKLLLTFIGINLGAPLVMVLMDASETNFSGYRGAIEQARLQFRRNQRSRIARFYRPYWHWKVRGWLRDDPALLRAYKRTRKPIDPFRHRWQPASWPYIEPTKDALADFMRGANSLDARRTIAAERGGDLDTIQRLNIQDNAKGIADAIEMAAELNTAGGFQKGDPGFVTWQQVWQPPMAQGVTQSWSAELGGAPDEPAAANNQ